MLKELTKIIKMVYGMPFKGRGKAVEVFILYSDDPSSNPA